MDAFVALLTKKYHNSKWTDQEVGFAVARSVPIIPVKLDIDPYGFIGRLQALSCDWGEAPLALAKLLIRQPQMVEAYIGALPKCLSFDQGNTLASVLPSIDTLSKEQADRLMNVFNDDSQLRGSFGFSGEKPSIFGDGLAVHLTRASGQRYIVNSQGRIERKRR
jgi:hypothetical protein